MADLTMRIVPMKLSVLWTLTQGLYVFASPVESYSESALSSNPGSLTNSQVHSFHSNYSSFAQTCPDFYELQKFASLASVAYCIEKNLSSGIVSEQGPRCPSIACRHSEVGQSEIVHVFRYDGTFHVGSGFIAVDRQSKTLSLSFRGTSSRQDWLSNLDAYPVSYTPMVATNDSYTVKSQLKCEGCRVHRGMGNFLKVNARPIIAAMVELKHQYPDYRILVTGHSLGAALSVLSGIELRLLGFPVLVVTMGGPKVGNSAFAQFTDELFQTNKVVQRIEESCSFANLKNGYIRMVHKNDVVPFLPPGYYHHSGYEYYLSNEGAEQTPDSLERRGLEYLERDLREKWEALPNVRRLEHAYYFIAVSHCI